MSEELIGIGALLSGLFVPVALLAGYGIGSLAFRGTVTSMRRTAQINLALLGVLGLLAGGIATLLLCLYKLSWWLMWDKALLFVPLIALPLTAAALFTVPRLLQLARLSASDPQQPANRTKRRFAAEAALVVPVQWLTIGSALYAVKTIFPLPPEFQRQLLIIVGAFLCAAALLMWRQSVRRRRIHRNDGTSALHAATRIGVYTTACLLLVFVAVFLVSAVRQDRIVPERYMVGVYAYADYGNGSPAIRNIWQE